MMVRRAALSGMLAAVVLVAVNATSAFAATTGDATPLSASSVPPTSAATAPLADVASTAVPTPTPSAKAPTVDASPSASTPTAGVVHAAALATDIVLEPHLAPPQPPLVDGNGYPLIGVGFAGTPDGAGGVTYGGVSASGAASSAASWVWNGTSWAQVCAACAPGARGLPGMATDLAPAMTGVVMYGGAATFGGAGLADTWVFADGTWVQRCLVCPPGARFGAAMAGGGAAGDQVLLFGGAGSGSAPTVLNDTWGFDGTTWSLLDAGVAGDPVPRFGASMAWDGTRFILFGGAPLLSGGGLGQPIDDGTWMWTGDHWTQLCANAAACGPAPRSLPRTAFLDSTDPSRRGVLLVGGLTISGTPIAFGDIWFWHDGHWIQQVSPWVDQQPFPPAGPTIVGGGLASRDAFCQVSLTGQTDANGTVSTFELGLDTNGDGVIDPCPAVPPAPPVPTGNVVAPASATAGTAEATATGTLPFTGSDPTGVMVFASGLLAVGLVLVAAGRRTNPRRRARSRVGD